MKFRLTFKTPDVLDNCQVYQSLKEDEQEAVEKGDDFTADKYGEDIQNIENTVELYVESMECITIEFDTDGRTARVIKARP